MDCRMMVCADWHTVIGWVSVKSRSSENGVAANRNARASVVLGVA